MKDRPFGLSFLIRAKMRKKFSKAKLTFLNYQTLC